MASCGIHCVTPKNTHGNKLHPTLDPKTPFPHLSWQLVRLAEQVVKEENERLTSTTSNLTTTPFTVRCFFLCLYNLLLSVITMKLYLFLEGVNLSGALALNGNGWCTFPLFSWGTHIDPFVFLRLLSGKLWLLFIDSNRVPLMYFRVALRVVFL